MRKVGESMEMIGVFEESTICGRISCLQCDDVRTPPPLQDAGYMCTDKLPVDYAAAAVSPVPLQVWPLLRMKHPLLLLLLLLCLCRPGRCQWM